MHCSPEIRISVGMAISLNRGEIGFEGLPCFRWSGGDGDVAISEWYTPSSVECGELGVVVKGTGTTVISTNSVNCSDSSAKSTSDKKSRNNCGDKGGNNTV